MTYFAYFRTQDNTIAFMELQRFDPTSGTYGVDLANMNAEIMGWELIEYGPREWDAIDWDENYSKLEDQGYFTRERQAELFDTVIVGTLDRLDI